MFRDRKSVAVSCDPDSSRTKQSFKDQVNINKIIARFAKTGMIDSVNRRQPFYGDVSNIRSYHDAMNVVVEAQRLFGSMSASIRKKFDNDPAKMIAWLDDPKNLDEAVALGMAVKRPERAPAATPTVVSPVTPTETPKAS